MTTARWKIGKITISKGWCTFCTSRERFSRSIEKLNNTISKLDLIYPGSYMIFWNSLPSFLEEGGKPSAQLPVFMNAGMHLVFCLQRLQEKCSSDERTEDLSGLAAIHLAGCLSDKGCIVLQFHDNK